MRFRLLLGLALCLTYLTLEAQIPRTLSYQGVITDFNGDPISDDIQSFTLLATQDALLLLDRKTSDAARPMSGSVLEAVNKHEKLSQLQLDEKGMLSTFTPIDRNSDHELWQKLTRDLAPTEDYDIHSHVLHHSDEGTLIAVWVKQGLPAETHTKTLESALLVAGDCTGYLGDREISIKPGDFLDIPLHVKHALNVVSDHPAQLIIMRKRAS